MAFERAYVTEKGRELIAYAMANDKAVEFTKAQIGTGAYRTEEKEKNELRQRTGLKEILSTLPIMNKKNLGNGNWKLTMVISNMEFAEDKAVTELAVFAKAEGHEEILYSISVADLAETVPKYNGEYQYTITEEYMAVVSSDMEVTIAEPVGAYALAADLAEAYEDAKRYTDEEIGKLSDTGDVHNIAVTTGYTNQHFACICKIKPGVNYQNQPILFHVIQRGRNGMIKLQFANGNGTQGYSLFQASGNITAYIKLKDNWEWYIYVGIAENYDNISVTQVEKGSYMGGTTITWLSECVTELPAGYAMAAMMYDPNLIARQALQDGDGNEIKNTYASKSLYSDTTINIGRKPNTTVGNRSTAEGEATTASGGTSHAEGSNTTASGYASHAEGSTTTASGNYSHAEGTKATGSGATGTASHTEGGSCTASGEYSHAEGEECIAKGYASHAEGNKTTASNYASHASGKFSKEMSDGGKFNNQIGDAFVVGNGTGANTKSNALRITYLGEVLGTKAFQSSGADYAEFIKPWADGNEEGEDRVGYFVTIRDGLLYKADEGDYIAGITSGNPSVVGNGDEDYYWRYERDEFNRIIMEDVPEEVQATENRQVMRKAEKTDEEGNLIYEDVPVLDEEGNPVYEEVPLFDEETHEPIMIETGKIIPGARMKLADGYNPSMQNGYVERKDRREWDYVGMVGVLPLRDDGTCIKGKLCRCGKDGIATIATERGFDTFYVIERISDNVVSVIMR